MHQFTCAIPVLYSICPEILSPVDKLFQLYLIEDKYEGNEVENICIFPQSGVLTISQNVLPAHTWVSFCRTGEKAVFCHFFGMVKDHIFPDFFPHPFPYQGRC